VGARFFAPVQTGPGAHPASCTMGIGCFPGVKRPGRDHPPLLAPRSRMSTAIPLLPCVPMLACYRVTFTFYFHLHPSALLLFQAQSQCYGQTTSFCVSGGFGGLAVSMMGSGTQDRGFAPQHAFLRRGSKIICPMSQLWGMKKNPALFVNYEIAGQIPLVPSFASRVRGVSG
jgi:hypothetical protein